MTAISTVAYVQIETNPWQEGGLDGEPILRRYYAALPEVWVTALDGLLKHLDNSRCWLCGVAVGFVLHTNDRLYWETTSLAREGDGPVTVLCEGCTPSVPDTPYDPQIHSQEGPQIVGHHPLADCEAV